MTDNFVPARIKTQIALEDLEKIDVRVGTIIAVEDIAESNKLLCLTVDFGDRKATVLAGMKKERNNPAKIIGTQALFVVNLEPRTMFGRTSEGMLFDIGYQDGLVPVLALPENPVPNGTRAG
jgi:tRNA-binding protein